MNRIFHYLFFTLLSYSYVCAQNKTPIPEPSENLYDQSQYLVYMRRMDEAAAVLKKAQEAYKKKNQTDSLTLSMISRARMLTLTGRPQESQKLVDSTLAILANPQDTLPEVKAFVPFVQTGNLLATYDIAGADSSGRLALEAIEKSVGACHFIHNNMLNDHGVVKFYQGKYLLADSLVNKSLACADQNYGEEDMRRIPSLNLGGTIKDFLGYQREAIKLYEQALYIMRQNNRHDSYDYARILNNLAGAYYDNGGALKAIETYEESLKLTEKFDDVTNNKSGVYYNMANMLNSIGYRNKALDYLNISIELMESAGDENNPLAHYPYVLKSSILASLERYEEAEVELQKGRNKIASIFPEDFEVQIEFLRRYAGILNQIGNHAQSLKLIDSTLQIIAKKNIDINLAHRGEFYFLAGEVSLKNSDPEKAKSYFLKSIADYYNGAPDQQKEAAVAYANLGNIYLELGQLTKAIDGVLTADSLLTGKMSEDILDDQPSLNDYVNLQNLNEVLATKIKVLLHLYETQDDDIHLLRAMDAAYVLEEELNQRTSAYLEGDDAISRINEYYSYYSLIVKTRLLAAEELDRKDIIIAALQTIESTKDLLYKNALLKAKTPIGIVPDSILQQEQKLLSQIDLLKEQRTEAQLMDEATEEIDRELVKAERKWDEFKLLIQENYPGFYSKRFEAGPVPVEQIQSQLSTSNSNILQYFLGDEFACVFIITPVNITVVNLDNPKEIKGLLKKSINDIRSLGKIQSLSECHQKLFKPATDFIKGENIIIIPDGLLHFIPFEAFLDESGQYLIESYNFSYNHSLGSIPAAKYSNESLNMLSVAPGFEEPVFNFLREHNPNYPSDDIIRQPNALKLAAAANNYFTGRSLSGLDATEVAFKEKIFESNVLLLASHAAADEEHPLYSRVSLLPDSALVEDGILHAYEILTLSLDHKLAILSACQTGLGDIDRGQGASSLSQAFRLAGCENVIMSLWNIDEKQSIDLLDNYLQSLSKNGEQLSASLNQTKRDYLAQASPELSHPFYWAGLVFVGSDALLPSSDVNYIWWGLIIGVLVIIILFFYRRNN